MEYVAGLCMVTMVHWDDKRVAQWGRRIHWTAVRTEAELNINVEKNYSNIEGINTGNIVSNTKVTTGGCYYGFS
jgi:hypothetical protein